MPEYVYPTPAVFISWRDLDYSFPPISFRTHFKSNFTFNMPVQKIALEDFKDQFSSLTGAYSLAEVSDSNTIPFQSYRVWPLGDVSSLSLMNSSLKHSIYSWSRCVCVSLLRAMQFISFKPAPSMKGQFGPNGALYSGWETRRHNQTYDWCIIQLGTTGTLKGLDVDTANFNGDCSNIIFSCHFYSSISLGNEAPAVSVYALHDADQKDPQQDDSRVR